MSPARKLDMGPLDPKSVRSGTVFRTFAGFYFCTGLPFKYPPSQKTPGFPFHGPESRTDLKALLRAAQKKEKMNLTSVQLNLYTSNYVKHITSLHPLFTGC